MRARKRFGQHFLTDDMIIQQIIEQFAAQKDDVVVEIGPGYGALTTHLLQNLPALNVIEIDRDLSAELDENFRDKDLTIYNQDVLTFDFTEISPTPHSLRIIGNLPYNISTPLIFHLANYKTLIHDALFMLQKEVVDRLTAPPGDKTYGRLSIMAQYHFTITQVLDVPPEAFTPPPKVESAIISLTPHNDYHVNDEERLSLIVREAFNHRRKTLKRALKDIVTLETFEHAGIDPTARPETLTVQQFCDLADSGSD